MGLAAGYAAPTHAEERAWGGVAHEGVWTHVGGTAARNALSRHALADLGTPTWTRATDASGQAITFFWQSTPAVSARLVVVPGVTGPVGSTQFRLHAFRREDGSVAWSSAAFAPGTSIALQTQSSATIDVANDSAIMGVGSTLFAVRLSDGSTLWQATLPSQIVNATACVTDDLGPGDRAFVTDYNQALGGRIYCVNVDPFDAVRNPHQPGSIVWSVAIGNTSGNSPAYLPRRLGGVGLVYVATTGTFRSAAGWVMALPVDAPVAPVPEWITTNPEVNVPGMLAPQRVGFYGGVVAVRGAGGQPEVLAAGYNFDGPVTNSNVLRLSGVTGAILENQLSSRSAGTPIDTMLGVMLSGGYGGSGSVPSLRWWQAGLGAMQWDSALATWVDLDGDMFIDAGEYTRLGGWNHQPAVALFGGKARLATGTIPNGSSTLPAQHLSAIDVCATPTQAGFVATQSSLAGGSVALAGANVYSVGSAGLAAFGPSPTRFDVDGSLRATVDDLYAWEAGAGARDVNFDGAVDGADRDALARLLRSREGEREMEVAR